MLTTRDISGVEILSVGSWHGTGCPPAGCDFTTDDLDEIAATYAATKDTLSPPLKIGHDDNQKLLQADGYPAAGWLSNVRREGQKLLADLLKVPAKIADLIDVGAYRNRSVELEGDYEIAGKKYGIALTGMALLGADLPAVENLGDITAWYSRQKLSLAPAARAVLFTVAPALDFALPAGMSYDDLTSALRTAFCDANPGASTDDCWVSDLYEGSAIFALDGRYWQQSYTVGKGGALTMTGMPAEVQRVTEWRSLSKSMRYADQAEGVRAALPAYAERTEQLVALRAKEGRPLSEGTRGEIATTIEIIDATRARLAKLAEPATKQTEPDYSSLMRSRARLAQLRAAELVGA